MSNQQTLHQLLEETGGSDFGLPKLVRDIFQPSLCGYCVVQLAIKRGGPV